jgi:signal peptidase I
VLGHVASAIDTLTLTAARARWSLVLVGWAALIVGSLVVDPLKYVYRDHYAQAFTNPSASMMDTLLVGDYILIDKSVYRRQDPQRGDIVVFKYPQDERRDFIKRIVAMPGEQVTIRGQQVFIDGRPLSEPYVWLASPSAPTGAVPTYCGYAYGCEPTTVPAGSYFVMGDNRDNSQDSRYWGFVKREKIKGKAFAIYWSWDGDRHWLRWAQLGRAIS